MSSPQQPNTPLVGDGWLPPCLSRPSSHQGVHEGTVHFFQGQCIHIQNPHLCWFSCRVSGSLGWGLREKKNYWTNQLSYVSVKSCKTRHVQISQVWRQYYVKVLPKIVNLVLSLVGVWSVYRMGSKKREHLIIFTRCFSLTTYVQIAYKESNSTIISTIIALEHPDLKAADILWSPKSRLWSSDHEPTDRHGHPKDTSNCIFPYFSTFFRPPPKAADLCKETVCSFFGNLLHTLQLHL